VTGVPQAFQTFDHVNLRTVVSQEQQRRNQAATFSTERLIRILERALPGYLLSSFELLAGGSSNLNYLLRFSGSAAPLVLRFYTRDPDGCAKELAVLRAARGILPVPELIHASPKSEEDPTPYAIYRFIEGITFQELKSKFGPHDIAGAAYAIGSALARVHTVEPPPSLAPGPAIADFDSPLLEQRLGGREWSRLRDVVSRWWPRIAPLYQERALVHGDFNNRNSILRQENGRWVVSGILDWELAFAGSPLWDAARFICYEDDFRPCREPHFSRGFSEGGGTLPEEWTAFARIINVVGAAESLSRPDLPSRFVPELRDLIVAACLRL
jgi:aminoglycoside phosphotransferase (APT) family kinase protein